MRFSRMVIAAMISVGSAWFMTGMMTHAASFKTLPSHVYLLSHPISSAPYIVAIDPWSGKETSYMSIPNLRTMLDTFHIRSQWNRITLTLTTPWDWSISMARAPRSSPAHPNNDQLYLDIGEGQFGRFPKLIIHGITYAPVYYINQVLVSHLLMSGHWHDGTWMLKAQKPLSVNQMSFQDLHMTSAQDGWAVVANQHEDQVVRTINGGKTWSKAGPIRDPQLQLSVFNSRIAAVLADAPLRLHPAVSHLFVTRDGGEHWSTVALSSHNTPFYPMFAIINAQGTWVVGTRSFPDTMPLPDSELLRVANGGSLKRVGSVPAGAHWLWMGRDGMGLLWCGNRTDALFTTANGGASWKRADIVGIPIGGGSLSFPASPFVFAQGTLFELPYYSFPTSTAGTLSVLHANGPLGPWTPIWSKRFALLTNSPHLFLSSAAQWYIDTRSAPRTLWRTVDSGKSWTREHTNIPLTEITDIQFVTPKIAFGLFTHGLSSFPVVTRDGGVTWTNAEQGRGF